MCTHTDSQSVIPDLVLSASPGNLLDMQIHAPYFRPTLESGAQPSIY